MLDELLQPWPGRKGGFEQGQASTPPRPGSHRLVKLVARRSWTKTADRFPAYPRAPIALLLAAELADQTGDTKTAEALRDRLVTRYPSTLEAGTARLNRSIVALHEHREADAVRDLDEAVRTHGTSVVHHRRRTLE